MAESGSEVPHSAPDYEPEPAILAPFIFQQLHATCTVISISTGASEVNWS